jgi:exodeoxyribonuclease VII small subunit
MPALTLEQKLTRLQEIQQLIETKKVSLSESMPLLEEAFTLKKEIEDELNNMENKIHTLSKTSSQQND